MAFDTYAPIIRFDKRKEALPTMKYICELCGYEYDEDLGDPENNIEAGTRWDELPEDFECPLCGVPKDQFVEAE